MLNETQFLNYLQEPQAEPCLLARGFRFLSWLCTLHKNQRERRCECRQRPVLSRSRQDHANNLCTPWCHRGFDGNFRCCTFCKGWPQGSRCASVLELAASPIKLPSARRFSSDIVSSSFSRSSRSAQSTEFAAALGYIWSVAIQVPDFQGVRWNDCHPHMFSKKVVPSLLIQLVPLLAAVLYTSGDIFQTAFKIKIEILDFCSWNKTWVHLNKQPRWTDDIVGKPSHVVRDISSDFHKSLDWLTPNSCRMTILKIHGFQSCYGQRVSCP